MSALTEPIFDHSQWQTDRDLRRRAIDEALQGGYWHNVRELVATQIEQDERLIRWLDKRIVADRARGIKAAEAATDREDAQRGGL